MRVSDDRCVSFSADALFAFNSAVIRPKGTADLDTFASELRATKYSEVHVYGYADRIGPEAYNLKLSRERADSVKTYLVDKGVKRSKIEIEGLGTVDPVRSPEGHLMGFM